MTIRTRQVTTLTESLYVELERLIPQLSPHAAIPSREALQRVVAGPSTALFASFAGSEAVGMLTLAWYDTPSGRKAWIEDVVVDAARRGCGAGRALLEAALERAAAEGAERVMLTSSPRREAARVLYRKMGFLEAETTVFVLDDKK